MTPTEGQTTTEAKRDDSVLHLETNPDRQNCLACSSYALDTGWECADCGYDNMPWYYPAKAEK